MPTPPAGLDQSKQREISQCLTHREQLGQAPRHIDIQARPATPSARIAGGERDRDLPRQMRSQQRRRDRLIHPAVGAIRLLYGVG